MKKVKEIQSINGPYPPTAEGVSSALYNAVYDQDLGKTKNNDHITILFEDGSTRNFDANQYNMLDYEAAEICHELGIEHDASICVDCAPPETDEARQFARFADTLADVFDGKVIQL